MTPSLFKIFPVVNTRVGVGYGVEADSCYVEETNFHEALLVHLS